LPTAVQTSTFIFDDHDSQPIFVRKWEPAAEPVAVVQIAHGMQEHSGRYDHVAQSLGRAGYVVYANDHRGHGKTASGPEDLGHLGPGGWESALAGLRQLSGIIRDEHPGKPLFALGHSFGSFLIQAYIQRYGEDLRGAVLSGTNGRNLLLRPGLLAARLIARREGLDTTATTLRKLSVGGYNKAFEPGETGKEWLSRDRSTVRAYVEDPLCGGDVPNSFFLELIGMLDAIWRPEQERRIPRRLPIYLFSGTECPVGNRIRGVVALARRYQRLGIGDVTVRFYEGGRHEMLNEINRDEVIGDLIGWLDSRCRDAQDNEES
jgi:alpha-beta hydrolase superfamily lysophospholipase